MRKVFFSLLVIVSLGFAANKASAQTASTTTPPLKIGVFDIDNFVQMTPDFKTVIRPKLETFQKDSIGPKKDQLDTLFSNAQTTYKNDSLAKKSSSILSYDRSQLQNIYYQEMNWNQIAQQATQQKYAEVAKPTYDKVIAAYKKVIADNKITCVLNPQAVSDPDNSKAVINLFDLVAQQMGIKLDTTGGQQDAGGAAGN